MTDRPVLIEDSLTTSAFAHAFRAGWLDAEGITLVERSEVTTLRDAAVAVVDSIVARSLLGTHLVARDAAVATRRASMITLVTHTRPDEVDHVTASLPDVSPATRAVAAVVVPAFYGITVTGWTTEALQPGPETAIVQEGAPALIPLDDEESYQEDLGRAWFLFTDTPFVSHVLLVRRDLLAGDPAWVSAAVARLAAARDLSRSRGRELRRDLSRDLGIEREVLTDALADQSLYLGNEEQSGLEELWKRAGQPLSQAERRGTFVSVRGS